jgi:hypothetical protein
MSRVWSFSLIALLAALGTSGSRAGQPPDPGASPEPGATVEGLTVIGPRPPGPEELPHLVFKFTQSHGAPGRIGQLSRWAMPVCPKTRGLPPEFNSFVTARVVEVAARVGAPSDKNPACEANVLILFTTEPQRLMEAIRRDYPDLLGFHYRAQAKRLATFKRPIQSWYVTGTKPRDGYVELDSQFHWTPSGSADSRLTSKLRSEFLLVLVVVDANKAQGREIGAVADNVAMLSLARPAETPGCSALPSALDAMAADCQAVASVDGLTPYDAAYLKGLYASDPEDRLLARSGKIAGRMVRELKGRQAAK